MTRRYSPEVRDQYERFPYPPRKPDDERQRLLEVEIDRLAAINCHCFAGANDFRGARVLVAGGGTGDSAIFLAEQLRARGGEVVYLDLSAASMAIAQQRAAVRGLDNIRWLNDSLLALTASEHGLFDYISCTGVLHHLEDPEAGLKQLAGVLKPTGAMGIMLYARYGRTGVYQMQQLMRLINAEETDIEAKIANTRTVLGDLPETNWFRHNERMLSDHQALGDAGLVDLLLHEVDTAFSIGEVYDLLGAANLHLLEFADVRLRMAYQPALYIRDTALLEKIESLDTRHQQAIAELLAGAFRRHEFYAAPTAVSPPSIDDLSLVPFFYPERDYRLLGSEIHQYMVQNPGQPISLTHKSGFQVQLEPDPLLALLFKHIDGSNDTQTILRRAMEEFRTTQAPPGPEPAMERLRSIYALLNQYDWLMLRRPEVGEFTDTVELHAASPIQPAAR